MPGNTLHLFSLQSFQGSKTNDVNSSRPLLTNSASSSNPDTHIVNDTAVSRRPIDYTNATFLPTWPLSLFSHAETTTVLPSISNGLSHLTTSQLQSAVEPILRELRNIDAQALLQLECVDSDGAMLGNGLRVRPIHELVKPPSKLEQKSTVRYIHLHEIPDQYSMGIFVFPPGAKIPLHDHPGMCVVSRLLYGDVVRLSLDLPRDGDAGKKIENPETLSSSPTSSFLAGWRSSFSSLRRDTVHDTCDSFTCETQRRTSSVSTLKNIPGAKQAYLNKVDKLVAPDVTCLFPFEGNLHEFVAGPYGAAVLDVLLPPYDADHHRDCTFFRIVPASTSQTNPDHFFPVDCSSSDYNHFTTNENNRRSKCWIVPSGQPDDFHCISGSYRGLGDNS